MSPVDFPEANSNFGPPPDMSESQVVPIRAFTHQVAGGSCDGSAQVVVGWKPDARELAIMNEGGIIYISMLGGLAPHYPSMSFYEATHPA